MSDGYEDKWPHEMTRAELLAEMGGEKAWFCNAYDTVHWTGTCRHTLDGCCWVWIVKEDDDE